MPNPHSKTQSESTSTALVTNNYTVFYNKPVLGLVPSRLMIQSPNKLLNSRMLEFLKSMKYKVAITAECFCELIGENLDDVMFAGLVSDIWHLPSQNQTQIPVLFELLQNNESPQFQNLVSKFVINSKVDGGMFGSGYYGSVITL